MLNENFAIIGSLVIIFGDITYLIETIQGKVKPNRVSWLMWCIAPMIAFAAELSKGIGIISTTTFAVGFIPLLIFLSTYISKKALWKLTKFDFICGGLSALALLLWFITKEANLAIVFSILADLFAFFPTYKKAFFNPESESSKVFFFNVAGSGITLLAVHKWTFPSYAFLIYLFVACGAAALLIQFKLGKRFSGKNLRSNC